MNKNKDSLIEYLAQFFIAALSTSLLWALFSCSSTQYVPVQTNHTDSIYLSTVLRDSVYVKDSIYIKERNDTVFVDKLKYIYKHILIKDTMYIERIDTISVPIPVEKKLSFFERINQKCNDLFAIITCVIFIYILLRWLVRKSRKE